MTTTTTPERCALGGCDEPAAIGTRGRPRAAGLPACARHAKTLNRREARARAQYLDDVWLAVSSYLDPDWILSCRIDLPPREQITEAFLRTLPAMRSGVYDDGRLVEILEEDLLDVLDDLRLRARLREEPWGDYAESVDALRVEDVWPIEPGDDVDDVVPFDVLDVDPRAWENRAHDLDGGARADSWLDVAGWPTPDDVATIRATSLLDLQARTRARAERLASTTLGGDDDRLATIPPGFVSDFP